MISAIRNKFGSKLLDIFIWISVICFVVLYVVPFGKKAQKTDRWVVTVNDEVASYDQYRLLIDNLRQQQRMLEPNSKPREDELKKTALKMLENSLIFKSQEEKLNLVLSQEGVRKAAVKYLPDWALNAEGKIDIGALQQKIGGNELQVLMMAEQLQQDLENALNSARGEIIESLLQAGLYVPEFALNNYYRNEYAFKKFSIVTLPYQKFAAQVAQQPQTDAQLKSFFEANNRNYWTTEKRSGTVWSFKAADFGIKLNEKQLKNYYYKNRESKYVARAQQVQVRRILFAVDKAKSDSEELKTQMREKAEAVRGELAADPTRFTELVKLYSDDKVSAGKDGLVDFFGKNEKNRAFSHAAFELRGEGEISEVFESPDGFEILQLVQEKPAEYKKLEEVEADIRKELLQEQFDKLFATNVKRVISQSEKDPQALVRFVQTKHATEQKINLQELGDKPTATLSKLFELKKVGAKAYEVDKDGGRLIVLNELIPSKSKEFEKVKSEVLADYKKDLLLKSMEAAIAELTKGLKAGSDLKELAQAKGLAFEQTPLIAYDSLGKIDHLKKKGFPTDLLWRIKTVGGVAAEISEKDAEPNGYLVLLDVMQKPGAEDFEKRRSSMLRNLFELYKAPLSASFVDSLRKNAKIKVNTAIL